MSFRHVTKNLMSTGAKLRNIILLVRDIEVSAHFYRSAIGVAVLGKGENIIQLDSGGTAIILKVCEVTAELCC
jgi:catechol-2,3-dioxygenase